MSALPLWTSEAQAVVDLALELYGPWKTLPDLKKAVDAYRASLQPKPRYHARIKYGAGIIDDESGGVVMAWQTCASVMNLADRYEKALKEIAFKAPTSDTVGIAQRTLEDKK